MSSTSVSDFPLDVVNDLHNEDLEEDISDLLNHDRIVEALAQSIVNDVITRAEDIADDVGGSVTVRHHESYCNASACPTPAEATPCCVCVLRVPDDKGAPPPSPTPSLDSLSALETDAEIINVSPSESSDRLASRESSETMLRNVAELALMYGETVDQLLEHEASLLTNELNELIAGIDQVQQVLASTIYSSPGEEDECLRGQRGLGTGAGPHLEQDVRRGLLELTRMLAVVDGGGVSSGGDVEAGADRGRGEAGARGRRGGAGAVGHIASRHNMARFSREELARIIAELESSLPRRCEGGARQVPYIADPCDGDLCDARDPCDGDTRGTVGAPQHCLAETQQGQPDQQATTHEQRPRYQQETRYEQETPHEQEPQYQQETPHEQEPQYQQEKQYEQETLHEQEPQYQQETLHEQETRYEQETPHEQEPQYQQETPHEQETRYEQETPHEQETRYEQETPQEQEPQYQQETPDEQETRYEQETPDEQEPQYQQDTLYQQETRHEKEIPYEQETIHMQETIHAQETIYAQETIHEEETISKQEMLNDWETLNEQEILSKEETLSEQQQLNGQQKVTEPETTTEEAVTKEEKSAELECAVVGGGVKGKGAPSDECLLKMYGCELNIAEEASRIVRELADGAVGWLESGADDFQAEAAHMVEKMVDDAVDASRAASKDPGGPQRTPTERGPVGDAAGREAATPMPPVKTPAGDEKKKKAGLKQRMRKAFAFAFGRHSHQKHVQQDTSIQSPR